MTIKYRLFSFTLSGILSAHAAEKTENTLYCHWRKCNA